MTRKQQTAAELMAELSRNPTFVASKKRREDEEMRVSATLKEEEKTLVSDLKTLGVLVNSVWDLVNTSDQYPVAIPMLTRHLSMPYSQRTKEGIARALTVPYGGSETLRAVVKEFNRQNANSETSLKWVLGNAIGTIATPADADMLIQLVMDRSNGKSRAMIVLALPRVVRDRARLRDVLRELERDGDVSAFAKRARTATRQKN
jgi:hypothetical protein